MVSKFWQGVMTSLVDLDHMDMQQWGEVQEIGGMVTWSPCFSRNFNDWELDVVNNFFL